MQKALIVEDELKAQRIIEHLLSEYFPEVKLIAKADNVLDGIKAAQEHQPDLVFLDVEMPVYSGFKFLEFFENPDFEIIFTTAYSDHTLKAFECCAIGYLLKPIQISLFVKTVTKALSIRSDKKAPDRFKLAYDQMRSPQIERIALADSEGFIFTKLQDIIMLKADGPYTHVFLSDKEKIVISKTLKEFANMLDKHPDFFRTHRSYMINVQHMQQYIKAEGGKIRMTQGYEAEIARERKDEFNQFLASWKI